MFHIKKIFILSSTVLSINLYAAELEKRHVYCVSKTDQSYWYWAMNPNGTYLEVEGVQSVGICSPYLVDPNAILVRNFFFIDGQSYDRVESACGDNYYSQPGEARLDVWYRFAKGNPRSNQFTIMPGYRLCKNAPHFKYVILKE